MFHDSIAFGGKRKVIHHYGQMLHCCHFIIAVIRNYFNAKVSGASMFFCWFKVKRLAQGKLCKSCWWKGKNLTHLPTVDSIFLLGKYPKYPHVFVVFPNSMSHVNSAPSCHAHYPNTRTLLIRESLLWTITPQFSIALMTLENIQLSVVVIIAHWNIDINEMVQM